jgi:hypothetical protein
MATPASPLNTTKITTAVTAVGFGLNLLPFFVQGVETLFGKKTGQTKKTAVSNLVNASIVGIAGGFGLAGSPELAQTINTFRPLISQTIDQVATQLFPPAPAPEPVPVVAQPVQVANDASPDPVLNSAG